MSVDGWMYYNHAAIPMCAPHKEPDLKPIETGDIWKMEGSPLLARWTTDFNCEEKTNWWFVVRFAPFDVEQLQKSSRKHIRQALKKCTVERIAIEEKIEELYEVYRSAFAKYENADNQKDCQSFKKDCIAEEQNGSEFWGGFCKETGKLIGYMNVRALDDYAELKTTKLIPEFLNYRVSDALYYTVLDHYLNLRGKRYLSSGSRNINHKTNTEDYKITSFGYQKAYCRLHIAYNPKIRLIVKMIYPFRKLFGKLDCITKIHQINGVMKMEEIVRNEDK